MPPESWDGYAFSKPERFHRRDDVLNFLGPIDLILFSPKIMLSQTFNHGMSRGSWNTKAAFVIAIPEDLAVVGGFQTAGEPQECCFSAAALTEDHGDLSSRDFKIDAVQTGNARPST